MIVKVYACDTLRESRIVFHQVGVSKQARGIGGFTGILGHYRDKSPLQRNIEPEEVGKASLFLLSDLASGITGEILHVDAGYHVMGV